MDEEEKYLKARERVEEIKGFYSHLFTYIVVMVILMLVNFFSTPGFYWFLIVAGGWGFGLFWHAMGVFIFSRSIGSRRDKGKIKK
ncbi:MAG: 2TM domain-containing protein [Actinomycetota bacterium]